MSGHKYKGSLAKRLRKGEEPADKLDDLYKDLQINAKDEGAASKALLALAMRHVPGFRKAKKAGRKSHLLEYIESIRSEFGPLFARLAEDSAKIALYRIVKEARQTWQGPGGRKFSKLEIVTKISRAPSGVTGENIYSGVPPKTLLAWVTHSGPKSKLQLARNELEAKALQRLSLYAQLQTTQV